MRVLLVFLSSLLSTAQVAVAQGPADFPGLTGAEILGAPKLGNPQLIMGSTKPLEGLLHGLAAPAAYDWDGDGRKDLLIGEFETGECGVRVYLNTGTNEAPEFSDEYSYAETFQGSRLKVDSW